MNSEGPFGENNFS